MKLLKILGPHNNVFGFMFLSIIVGRSTFDILIVFILCLRAVKMKGKK